MPDIPAIVCDRRRYLLRDAAKDEKRKFFHQFVQLESCLPNSPLPARRSGGMGGGCVIPVCSVILAGDWRGARLTKWMDSRTEVRSRRRTGRVRFWNCFSGGSEVGTLHRNCRRQFLSLSRRWRCLLGRAGGGCAGSARSNTVGTAGYIVG